MKTHTVLTPANIEIEYRLAGAGSRLAAFIIDFTLQIILCLILAAIVLFGLFDYRIANLANLEGTALAFLIISWFTIYFCYFIFCELSMNGQSPGKKIFGLRVIRDNGQPVGLAQSLIRNLFRAVLDIIYIGLFFILFSPQHKRLGDMVAGTVVVAEHYDSESIPLRPASETRLRPGIAGIAGIVGIEQLSHLRLTQAERDLLQLYMARKIHLPKHSKKHLQKEWAEYFSNKWQTPAGEINDELLSALLQISS